uniref:Putative polyprotein n=1 Tax=Albugo laibachii Nc14 TaxID=890382 RepID=F0WCE4_9STRA|nr:putative polyprotein [Albugo laibachii Nc14]|eukprot:CCA18859.1 putative polyprotein [Albugo laibachii Nc14]
MREDFNNRTCISSSLLTRKPTHCEPEPMEICATQSDVHRPIRFFPPRNKSITFQQNDRKKFNGVCHRCKKQGHVAARCRAPSPVYSSANHTRDAPGTHEVYLSATNRENDARLILIEIEVEGASRRFRALVDSGTTNNFIGESCLVNLASINVDKIPGNMTVRLEDGVPRTTPKRVVAMRYGFDDFESIDKFLVINMGGKFNCIFGMSWIRKYYPEIEWNGRSVKAEDLAVNEVCADLAQP